ncbi:LOW QUALITY PROTEIN: stromelysin-3-like [Lepeophtheirus salmonis]|uniref:LOW QUALITY PROTEIN: stromelysin-3-like n=1 Tax=Lepeophtheirus salmonis TaxID=72036 RepID=UPI001AE3779F|nr:LOW QUALITY PROTEIN: matrix metalloproteinase-24-like [Lepeophtheirus salmonis]
MSRFLLFVMPFLLNYEGHSSLPVQKDSPSSALYYFLQYGYIQGNPETGALMSEDALKDSIRKFQGFVGVNITGELNDETVEWMNTPRCGVKDFVGYGTDAKRRRRRKRYSLQGSRWRSKDLTYRITKYPSTSRLSKKEVDEDIQDAFKIWEEVTNLNFRKKDYGSVHIEIRFERKEHGDGDPFDGPGGTLAHAYFPEFGGDAHFDNDEYWTVREIKGTNLLQAAAHEFGHSLGLSHSDVKSALMAPFYRGWNPNLKLHKDDIKAIQALYGAETKGPDPPTTTPTTTTSTTTTTISTTTVKRRFLPDVYDPDAPNLCKGSRIDAIFSTEDNSDYAFKGKWYWKLTDTSIEEGYPRKIAEDWPGLPEEGIDAGFTWTNDMTYIFKGSQYWKFKNLEPQKDYPRKIEDGFPGIPVDLDAVFVWGGNGKIYFFKNGLYYRFDPERTPEVSWKYPKEVQNWGFSRASAATQWKNGFTYFFMDDGTYYRFNDRKFQIDNGEPPFPRDAGKWWFGCKDNTLESDTNFYNFLGLRNDFQDIKRTFDEEGDETLDAMAGDE